MIWGMIFHMNLKPWDITGKKWVRSLTSASTGDAAVVLVFCVACFENLAVY